MNKCSTIKYCYLIFITPFIVCLFAKASVAQSETTTKIKGVTFRGSELAPLQTFMLESIATTHADWVAFVPTFVIDRQTLSILPEMQKYHWYESQIATVEGIKIANRLGYKVLLKPHLRLSSLFKNSDDEKVSSHASWRGTFVPKRSADWKIWEEQYEQHMLHWAKIADSLEVEMLCIGTELRISATKRALFWQQLIQKIRTIYSGQLIYSANWDEYKHIKFWEELDYIGVNAYFPISEALVPSVQEAVKSWKKHKKPLKRMSKKFELPILFTEFGYRNIQYAAQTPWQHEKVAATLNDQAQVNLYKAFFEAFAHEKWVSGYFLWQWFGTEPYHPNTLFTPQGKPALKVLQKWYKK